MRLYKELAERQTVTENEENDIRINGGATDAQLEWKRMGYLAQKRKPERKDLDAFETAYNAACGCIARGELGQGEVLLKRAKGNGSPNVSSSSNSFYPVRSLPIVRRSI